jgi:small redox-active disulfide protein 2
MFPNHPSFRSSIHPFTHPSSSMTIQILGTGCPKCNLLAQHAAQAAQALGIDHEIVKVTKIADIMKFGVMLTPALAVDGVVKCMGKVPSVDEIKTLIS